MFTDKQQTLIVSKFPKIFNLLDSVKKTNYVETFKSILENSKIEKTEYYDRFILSVPSDKNEEFKEIFDIWYNILYNNVTYSTVLPYCEIPFSKFDNSCEIIVAFENENSRDLFDNAFILTLVLPVQEMNNKDEENNDELLFIVRANVEKGEYLISSVNKYIRSLDAS